MRVEELLKQLQIEVRAEGDKHCRPGWVQMRCPFCSDGRTGSFHLGYNTYDGRLNCYRCGGHNLADALSKLSNNTFGAIKHALEGVDTTRREIVVRPTGTLTIPDGVGPLKRLHRDYLRGRGFDPHEISDQWGIGGIGQSTDLSWRLFIPIHYKGVVVSWTTRAIGKSPTLRYIAAEPEHESMNHRKLLYGEDHCEHSIIVHEGPVDVWRTGPGSVATFGTAFSKAQVHKIAQYSRRIICFDSGHEAQKQASRLCDMLSIFPGTTYQVELDAKDAGEASDKEIKRLRKMLTGRY